MVFATVKSIFWSEIGLLVIQYGLTKGLWIGVLYISLPLYVKFFCNIQSSMLVCQSVSLKALVLPRKLRSIEQIGRLWNFTVAILPVAHVNMHMVWTTLRNCTAWVGVKCWSMISIGPPLGLNYKRSKITVYSSRYFWTCVRIGEIFRFQRPPFAIRQNILLITVSG